MQLEQLSSSTSALKSNLRIRLLKLFIPQLWSQVGEGMFTIFICPKSGNGKLRHP